MSEYLHLRAADAGDVDGIQDVFLAARETLTFLPPLPPRDDVWRFLAGVVDGGGVTVAERDGAILGFLAVTPGWIDHLYIAPANHRLGIGTALLKLALADGHHRQLWCFQDNLGALAFYTAHGFVEVERTDGSTNMERCPDVRMEWQA